MFKRALAAFVTGALSLGVSLATSATDAKLPSAFAAVATAEEEDLAQAIEAFVDSKLGVTPSS